MTRPGRVRLIDEDSCGPRSAPVGLRVDRDGAHWPGCGGRTCRALPAIARGDEPHPKVDFNFQVRPILSDKCFNCHGPDPRMRKAGLRLDTKEGAFGTTKSGGHAVVPGNLEESELFARITAADETERMPPKSLGRSLSPEEINLLKRWIEQGAEWKPHWAFLPPVAAPVPDVKNPAGPGTRSTASSWPAWTPSG